MATKTVTAPYGKKITAKYTNASLKKMPDTGGDTYQITWTDKDYRFKYKPKGASKYEYKSMSSAVSEYEVSWNYKVGGVWFAGSTNTVSNDSATPRSDTYDPPENAIAVRCKIKPVSKTFKNSKDNDTKFFSGAYGKWVKKGHNNATNDPETPESPSYYVDPKTHDLLVYMSIKDPNTTHVKFRLAEDKVFDDSDEDSQYSVVTKKLSDSVTGYVYYDGWSLRPGHLYKLSARAKRESGGTSEWSEEWSDWSDIFETGPSDVEDFKASKTQYSSGVFLEWKEVGTNITEYKEVHSAVTYEIEYLQLQDETNITDTFVQRSSEIQTVEVGQTQDYIGYKDLGDIDINSGTRYFILDNLDVGYNYAFRIRAKNEYGYSVNYSDIINIMLATKPNAPTVWSKTSIITDGSDIICYWAHNSTDSSLERQSKIEYKIDDGEVISVTTDNPTDPYNGYKSETRSYTIPNPGTDGTIVKWRVATRGISEEFSDFSDWQEVKVYTKPSITLTLSSGFPMTASVVLTPSTQKIVDSSIQILAENDHQAIDIYGDIKSVSADELLYSKAETGVSSFTISARDFSMGSVQNYKVRFVVNTDAGLSAEAEETFTSPPRVLASIHLSTAILTLHPESLTASISGASDDIVALRCDVDGRYEELPIVSTEYIDKYAPFENALYKVVSFSSDGVDVGTKTFDPVSFGSLTDWSKATWSNGQLKRPKDVILGAFIQWGEDNWISSLYNLDISPSYKVNTTSVEYDGRKDPVVYYGTSQSLTDSWSMSVDKHDRDTIDKFRKLALYNGPVHIREPRGSSYWCTVEVGISESHEEPLVTVSLSITRSEGE